MSAVRRSPPRSPARAHDGAAPLHESLLAQLAWFIRLRWLAGGAVVLAAAVDRAYLSWFGADALFAAVGGAILAYNVLLLLWLRRLRAGAFAEPATEAAKGRAGERAIRPLASPSSAGPPGASGATDSPRRRGEPDRTTRLQVLAWVQVVLDLGCLTLLTVRTGGPGSPLLAFFVFHMVFASLLLSQRMAYGGAAVAVAMMSLALLADRQWPGDRDGLLVLAGWAVTLFLTVYLANHITRGIHQQGQRLARQNLRIRRMSRRLRVQQQQMVQHEKMAALGQMAAGVAHEISNPLASMSSLLQLMQRQPERPRPEAIDRLNAQVQRINSIIRQMNAFSHPAESQPQPVGLVKLLTDALEMVRFDRRLAEIEIRRRLPDDDPLVYVQPHAIQQVLINLVLNALDAMDDAPTRRLTLSAGRTDDWCFIEVADTGHGIAPEHMDRLFEPFFTTKPVGRGTGLGLAISYSLISKQGGRIEVRSTPGRGTAFTVCLPPADHFSP